MDHQRQCNPSSPVKILQLCGQALGSLERCLAARALEDPQKASGGILRGY